MKKLLHIIIGMLSKFFNYPLPPTPYTLPAIRYPLSLLLHAIPYTLLPILLILLPTPYTLHAAFALPTHLDPSKGFDCSSCHRTHGQSGTLLLNASNEQLCFNCHDVSGPGKDIKTVIQKVSAHDILNTAQYHHAGETLPETDPSQVRHVSCFDCHNVHRLDSTNTLKGVRGYDGRVSHISEATEEYQVCYMCHSTSANLPAGSHNIAQDFDPGNASFHPVETYGKNSNVPSLLAGYSTSSLIKCTDCHGNDDKTGPKGPHGSNESPILAYHYVRTPGNAEGSYTYELCYHCHSRTSILNNESFKAHNQHIVTNNVSCAQCHTPHGSLTDPYLIEFDTNYVSANSNGELSFQDMPGGKPRCFLTCHINGQSYEHILDTNTGLYCINSTIQNCPTGW